MPVFLSVKSAWLGGQAELFARRQIRLLVVFREEPLRFEEHSEARTQNCSRSQAIGQDDYPKTAQLAQHSAVPGRSNLRARSNGSHCKLRQTQWTSKLPRAFRGNHSSERRERAALCGTWRRPHDSFLLLRPSLRLAGNSEWRKAAHSSAQ